MLFTWDGFLVVYPVLVAAPSRFEIKLLLTCLYLCVRPFEGRARFSLPDIALAEERDMLSQWLRYSVCFGYAGARNGQNIGGIIHDVAQCGKLVSHVGGLESFLVVINDCADVFIGVHGMSHFAKGGTPIGEIF